MYSMCCLFVSTQLPPSTPSHYEGPTGCSIVLRCKSSLCYGQISFVCVLRGFCAGCVSSGSWKAPDYHQLCRGTPGSSVDCRRCIISSPLAKLLIEGVMSQAAPTRLAVTDARATHQPKALCVAQIAGFVTSGSGCCVCMQRPLWLRVSTRHCRSRPWPLQGVQMSRKRPPQAASAPLSAESECLATQEGDTKSPPNHLLSPALWSNASLAWTRVPWFEHWRAVTAAGQCCCCLVGFIVSQCSHQVKIRPLKTEAAALNIWCLTEMRAATGNRLTNNVFTEQQWNSQTPGGISHAQNNLAWIIFGFTTEDKCFDFTH